MRRITPTKVALAIATPTLALLAAMALGSLLMLTVGQAPGLVWGTLLRGTWGSDYGIGQILFKSTPLIFTGLSVAVSFRAGLFNVGAEGQMILGGLLAGLLGPHLEGWPRLLAVPVCAASACLGGAVMGAIPGVLKARTGAHEVIVTIMLNFVAQASALAIGVRFFLKESLHTAPIAEAARLPRIMVASKSAANLAIVVALLAAIACVLFIFRSRQGFRLRATGLSPEAARTAGISIAGVTVSTMVLAGALAGGGAIGFVQGYKYFYEDGFAGGAGFMGIAVALLGRNHPVGIVFAALLFGTLGQGGLAINALVSKEIIEILQALVIIAVAALNPEVERALGKAFSR